MRLRGIKPYAAIVSVGAARNLIGSVFNNRYKLLSQIGDGAHGDVYKAHDQLLDRVIAIKLLGSQNQSAKALQRFQREAQVISRLRNRHCVTVYEFGLDEKDSPYLIMEYLDGESLSALLSRENVLDPKRTVQLFMQLCDGLQHAHDNGISHRDLKPGNVIILDENGEEVAKVIDFGIAKLQFESDMKAHDLTRAGDFLGSPLYMSPEQTEGIEVGPETDQYSLGCMLYQCLTGNPPHYGSSTLETLMKHQSETPPSMTNSSPFELPPELDSIVVKLLAKNPNDRFASMADVSTALSAVDFGKSESSKPIREEIENSSNKAIWIVALVVVGLVATGTLLFISESDSKIDKPDETPKVSVPKTKPTQVTTEPKLSESDIRLSEKLRADPQIRELTIEFGITDRGLEALKTVSNIRQLDFTKCSNISANGFKANVSHLKRMDDLILCKSSASDDWLPAVLQMKKLRSLNLSKTQITDAGLRLLTKVQSLKNLDLMDVEITNDGLDSVRQLKNLTRLNVKETPIDDAGIKKLGGLKKLEFLALRTAKIDGECFDTIANMKSLEIIICSHTNITDNSLELLLKKKNWKKVDISECRHLSQDAIEKFKKRVNKGCMVLETERGTDQDNKKMKPEDLGFSDASE